jgi:hypothetical protein
MVRTFDTKMHNRRNRSMAYKPIHIASDLPPLGPVPEDLRFDMKMEVAQKLLASSDPAADLANDVAAFANVAGGVLGPPG